MKNYSGCQVYFNVSTALERVISCNCSICTKRGCLEMTAVNVRCLEGVDISTLSLAPFDGRAR
jgi:hypothetical protein